MKKKHVEMSDQELIDEADFQTSFNRDDAELTCKEAWLNIVGRRSSEPSDYATYGIFQDVISYLQGRTKDISEGVYISHDFSMRYELNRILSFSFVFSYDVVIWDGKNHDPHFPLTFESQPEWDDLPFAHHKDSVVMALRDFLLAGAVQAKKVSSDAYPIWRKLLIDLRYTYRMFEEGAKQEAVDNFLENAEHAAQMTAIDSEVFQRLYPAKERKQPVLSQRVPPLKKGKKKRGIPPLVTDRKKKK